MSRSTSNKYAAGGPTTRLKRKQWLVETYRADVDLARLKFEYSESIFTVEWREGLENLHRVESVVRLPACRCYRCGELLTVATVTVDRRVPGCEGGDYSPENIRPACGPCNSHTGGVLGKAREIARAAS